MSGTTPRLAPLPREEWGDDERAALAQGFGEQAADRFAADGPDAIPVPNVVGTLMHHPGLTGPFLAYNNVLLRTPTLEPRLRELMILRVAARTRSDYEWAQHVRIATGLGVTAAEIEAIRDDVGAAEWSALETELLGATDELIDHYRIADDTWTRLAAHLEARQLVEVVFVVGTYTGLAMAFNSFGLQLDDDLATTTARPESEE